MSLPFFQLFKTCVAMDDGRTLNLYDFAPRHQIPPHLELHLEAARKNPPRGPRLLEKPSEMRWNPTLGQWVIYASHRMNRPQLPLRAACPLCPGGSELPFNYQIAIFENRAPALSFVPGAWALPDTKNAFDWTVPARGSCDIVVYSSSHDETFSAMPVESIYALVEAWRDRYAELLAQDDIVHVSILENKGREAGMTLDHPHGQIFAFSFMPPDLETQWQQSTQFWDGKRGLWDEIIEKELREGSRIIAETDGFLAAVPFYARYPFEVHIWAKRVGVNSLLEMTPQERRELAGMMKNVTLRYQNLWPDALYGFPTLMLMQQLSKRAGAERFRFHIEFYPLQRAPEKLKYRASIETGAGTFLSDALPETQAAQLRAVEPKDVELPRHLFD